MACSSSFSTTETPLAFPGALGFGKYTQGGNEGQIVVVNTLADNAKDPIKGSLRWAVEQPFPRLVVFNVSGVIVLEDELKISHPNITLAGHTSPNGIVVTGASTTVKTHQVIIRHMRFRPGHLMKEGDALTVRNSSDVIIDHCSLSWSNDEVGSFYNNQRFTLQHSILSESLNNAGHHKGSHGYGGIWGGANASFTRNLLVSHTSRNPRINGWRLNAPYEQAREFVEITNNVIANWGSNSIYGGENGKANIINNLFIPGPASRNLWFYQLWYEKAPLTRVFLQGNHMKGHPKLRENNQLGVVVKNERKHSKGWHKALNIHIAKQKIPHLETETALLPLPTNEVWSTLIENKDVGANLSRSGLKADMVDERIFTSIETQHYSNNNGIIDSETQVINWEDYKKSLDSQKAISSTSLSPEAWRALALR